ncbi:MAG: ABC-F family ATP-binding cassette domain-containing protein [Dysgonamonadaceae bacterium]|jgi:ATP-binding cassette subfamily F protein uup|nr:ABC-F family ATP-binding cassette domain-containing protein [Dysgonamonadaceae bacterium]
MAVYLQVSALTKSFGDKLLFADVAFGIDEGRKTGLIARNGAGKSTLLNIIAGREDRDAGEIVFRRGLRVGYLLQNPELPSELCVLDAVLQKWRELHSEFELTESESSRELLAKQLLTQLNITDLNQKTGELSGGQLKRAALAAVLVTEPDLLLLDEPTNHLDLEMIEWLEDYLSRSRMTLLMVTHDRYFLDRVCNEIIELDNGQIYSYKGNYDYYLEKRQERIDARNAELERANNLFRTELEWYRRQPQARGTKAKARIDAFHELENKVRSAASAGNLKLTTKASYIGNKIFEAKAVTKRFGDTVIAENFNYTFSRYEKLGIAGANGAGKSTFVRMLLGEISPDSGSFDIGETVRFGYYSQDGLQFDEQMKVIDVVQNIAEVIETGAGKRLTASQFLQHFLFPPEKQHDFVHKLSGGEKRRLYLCTVLIKNPNFLILDEPTNDLDIITLNILEEYLAAFRGCLIVISHDRYFMDKVIDHLFVFKGNGEIQDFPGNYSQYREWSRIEEKNERLREGKNEKPAENKASKPRNENNAKKLTFKEKRELEELEQAIPELEEEQKSLEAELSDSSLNHSELLAKSQRISAIIAELDEKTERWLELLEKAEA